MAGGGGAYVAERDMCVRGACVKNASGWYASNWNAFLFVQFILFYKDPFIGRSSESLGTGSLSIQFIFHCQKCFVLWYRGRRMRAPS